MQRRLSVLVLLLLFLSSICLGITPTDRNVLLKRNNPIVQSFDSLATLSIGNGEFAMSVDPTGLQTFPMLYAKDNLLITQAEWLDRHLGVIGFEFPSTTTIEDFADITQTLVLNSGIIKTNYTLQGNEISIYTVCHPERDLVAAHIISELPIPIKLCFPYIAKGALSWGNYPKHSTRLVSKRDNAMVFKRSIDRLVYYVVLQWQGNVSIVEKLDNYYVVTPDKGHFAFSCEFVPHFTTTFDGIVLPTFKETAEKSATAWGTYWSSDCIKTLSDSTHLYTRIEEQRLILECYKNFVSGNKKSEETFLSE